jgi:hypothetical protein
MPARLRIFARCALAAAALSIAPAISPAGAFAGGPGVTVIGRQLADPLTKSGDQLAAGDVPSTSYRVRDRLGGATRTVQRGGTSVRSLLLEAGVDPSSIRRVAVSRGDGSDLVLTSNDLSSSPPFADGPAVISDDGSGTRILRPLRNSRDVNGRDDILTSFGAGPLVLRVDDATSLAVTAKASPTQVRTGNDVNFTGSAQSGSGPFTYHWDFGDGATAEGAHVSHSFDGALDQQIQLTVVGSCSSYCLGVDTVTVRVGNPPPGPDTPGATNPGSGTGNPDAPGSGTGTGAGGPGGSGGGTTAGATGEASVQAVVRELARQRAADRAKERARVKAVAQRKRLAAQRKAAADLAQRKVSPAEVTRPSGLTVTGVLLQGQGAPLQGGLPPLPSTPAGSPKGEQAARGTSQDDHPSVPATVGLALLVISMGALRERRIVRLRVA